MAEWLFWCAVGVVPQVDSLLLLERDCPVIAQQLRSHIMRPVEAKAAQVRDLLLDVSLSQLKTWQK